MSENLKNCMDFFPSHGSAGYLLVWLLIVRFSLKDLEKEFAKTENESGQTKQNPRSFPRLASDAKHHISYD